MSYTYLFSLAVILLSTKLLSMATGRLQLPQVVGSLLAGLIFGPACLGIIQPSEFLSQLSELGGGPVRCAGSPVHGRRPPVCL